MCGIVGILARNTALNPGLLHDATASLAHRGPDDSSSVILRSERPEALEIGLGHRRLAVLDLSPLGRQPMHDPQTGNWIVFNGEIYNFRELRQKLESKGHGFQSRSDTEVLLKAYAAWGRDCLNYLRGIFAFAIWDSRDSSLFLARDPMGVKPLYYSAQGSHFVFASEIRALLRTGLVPRKLDRAGLLSYLSFGSVYEPTTAIAAVSALRAGHYLTWKAATISVNRYWTAPPVNEDLTLNQAKQQLAESVGESVRMQTVSDVPLGVFLSGGIDSSAITAVLSRSRRPSTFSVVFREQEFNEASSSRAIAQRFRTDHHEILCTAEDGLELSRQAVAAMDQPTIDGLNTYLVCGVARQAGVRVAMSGLGGDELFCGYRTFRSVPRMERFLGFWNQVPARTAVGDFLLSGSKRSDAQRKAHALATENGRLVHPYFLARALFTPARARELIRDGADESALVPLHDTLAETGNMDRINRVSYLEARGYMLNTLLRDADVMSMAHGLELRVPLIDPQLTERTFTVPGRFKMRRGTPKPMLVNAVPELPDAIVHRRKQGFTFPFEPWLRNEMQAEVQASLADVADGPLADAVQAGAATRVWRDFVVGRTSWSRPWSLHVLHRWCERNQITT
jgi:asparagine synthase (glutamine-hydrolysing)